MTKNPSHSQLQFMTQPTAYLESAIAQYSHYSPEVFEPNGVFSVRFAATSRARVGVISAPAVTSLPKLGEAAQDIVHLKAVQERLPSRCNVHI